MDPGAKSVSVVLLNFNSLVWLPRCLESLLRQTIADRIEIIVGDNGSTDGSLELAEKLLQSFPAHRLVRHGRNLGFAEGNNRAADRARGKYLFFLNTDTWLAPDCLEVLVREVEAAGAQGGAPIVLNYSDDTVQSFGASGFDILGMDSGANPQKTTTEAFAWCGCAYLIEQDWFARLGGFDAEFFLYVEEYDLSWRVWAAGGCGVMVPTARVHHRGDATVNPVGGETQVRVQTSPEKRFMTNRNYLISVLKNAQHVLLLTLPLQLAWYLLEVLFWLPFRRPHGFLRRAYWDALIDCWRLRDHIRRERFRMRKLRRRSDWALLRFLRLRLNRWELFLKLRQLGRPRFAQA